MAELLEEKYRWTHNASSTLATLLVGAEHVDHFRDNTGMTWLKFTKPDGITYISPDIVDGIFKFVTEKTQ